MKPGLTSEAGIKYRNEAGILNKQAEPLKYNDKFFQEKIEMNLNYYQKGLTFIIGHSSNYYFVINDKLGLDIYAGVRTTKSFHNGYLKDNHERYDVERD